MGSGASDIGRILIVGGGITGLTTAAALRQRDFDIELVERSPTWEPIGSGIAVQPNGTRVLSQLGLSGCLEKAGRRIRRWLFRDQRGTVLADADLEKLWGDVGPFLGVARAKLAEVLLSGIVGIPSRLGTAVTTLRQTDGEVTVGFSDGSTGDYGLVIGADGISSSVRQLAFRSLAPVYGGQMVWRSLAPLPSGVGDSVQFWLGDGCFFGLCPVGDGLTYGFGNVTTPWVHDPVSGRLQRLRDLFKEFGGLVRDYLASLEADEQIHCGPIQWLERSHWHVGRVALIGDASHASSPMMGQGGSMAMEDALVLAETLQSTAGVGAGLDIFVARRGPRVDWVQKGSRAVGDMLRMPPDVRNAILRERGTTSLYDRFQSLTTPP
jgi:2-polyprenyl-6-methoxyphenol hydroxylase-like FAD-dependent oxidoreductase